MHVCVGELYNVPAESLAAECAAALKASKLIYLTRGETLVDSRSNKPVQSLRLAQAVALLEQWGLSKEAYNYVEVERDDEPNSDNHSFSRNGFSFYDSSEEEKKKESSPSGEVDDEVGMSDDDHPTIGSDGTAAAAGHPHLPVKNNFIDMMNNSAVSAYVRLLAKCVYSLTGGVRRAHLVPTDRGALLKELFTRDGAG